MNALETINKIKAKDHIGFAKDLNESFAERALVVLEAKKAEIAASWFGKKNVSE